MQSINFVSDVPMIWQNDDNTKNKLSKKGKKSLSNIELLALLISTGQGKDSSLDLAKLVLIKCNNDLNELAKLGTRDLCKIKGIGPAKAATIIAAIELASRRQSSAIKERKVISCSKDAYNILKEILKDLDHEEFWVLTLNRKNNVIGEYKVSEGGLTSTVVDQRKIFKIALDDKSTGVILCHNHPSGNPKASEADNQLTKKLRDGGRILDISILDHIIISQSGYYSFADEGKL
jgi:DNA repair protein RadC